MKLNISPNNCNNDHAKEQCVNYNIVYNASYEYKREENTLEGNNIRTFADAANETPLFCFIL